MFTGLVQSLAPVARLEPEGSGVRLVVRDARIAAAVSLGASVCVSGCCLTVVAAEGEELAFQAGAETLSRTTLGGLAAGDAVNLEPSLRVGDELGGHLVTGHVDGLGVLELIEPDGAWRKLWFSVERALGAQMASKGSVAVDGVSLTLVDVLDDAAGRTRFSVALIPHTLAVTTLGRRAAGDHVNIETDVLAKYVQRQLVR